MSKLRPSIWIRHPDLPSYAPVAVSVALVALIFFMPAERASYSVGVLAMLFGTAGLLHLFNRRTMQRIDEANETYVLKLIDAFDRKVKALRDELLLLADNMMMTTASAAAEGMRGMLAVDSDLARRMTEAAQSVASNTATLVVEERMNDLEADLRQLRQIVNQIRRG